MIVVVDASLAAKRMLWEADSRATLGFLYRKDHERCAPDLLLTEVAAAVVKRARMRQEIAADALEALRKWTVA